MEKVDTLIVDKTGTLTEGRPRVVHVEAASGFGTADQIVQKLASVERASEHPLAVAVLAAAARIAPCAVQRQDFDSPVGRGVVGTVDQQRIVSGNARFMDENGIGVGRGGRGAGTTPARCDGHLRRHRGPARRFRGDRRSGQEHDAGSAALRSRRSASIVMLTGDGKGHGRGRPPTQDR